MGVPVSGKNMFPSNIQGLPTWFTVRANGEGWTARRAIPTSLVAMNLESVVDDIAGIAPAPRWSSRRASRRTSTAPTSTSRRAVRRHRRRRSARRPSSASWSSTSSTWACSLTCSNRLEEVKKAIGRQFAKKASAAKLNTEAAIAGYAWAEENLPSDGQPFLISAVNATAGKIIIEGNQAAGLGLMFGGVTVLAWYPITPSSSLAEACIDYMQKYRHDQETGKATYAVIQAEDELASMAAVVGAGWAGARAATATAGPGISLMGELVGLSYFAEIRRSSSTSSAWGRARACRRAPARATSGRPTTCRTATVSTAAHPGPTRSSATRCRPRPSTSPSACRRACSSCSISTSG